MKRLATLTALAFLASCAPAQPPNATTRALQFSAITCAYGYNADGCATPPPTDSPVTAIYYLSPAAMVAYRTKIGPTATTCEEYGTENGDVMLICKNIKSQVVTTISLLRSGSIIPVPGHPGCFFAGVTGTRYSAIAAPLAIILGLLKAGSLAIAWANLAAYIGAGAYSAYHGC